MTSEPSAVAAKATKPKSGQIHRTIDIAMLHEHPLNPRRSLGDVTGLVESMRAHGFRGEHPLLVHTIQPHDCDPPSSHAYSFEVISGHRRLKAAREAGLMTVPCVVDDGLNAQAVLEIQLVENAQRADVHPLDEAQAFARLRDEFGCTISEIALRVGKSESHVSRRLSLVRLIESAQDAYTKEKITLEIAVELSRLPSVAMQTEALSGIIEPKFSWQEHRTAKQIIEAVREKYFLRLSAASWALNDATLTSAGACTTCPKRTGSQPALFADLEGVDTCTDVDCFGIKGAAALDRRVGEWKAKGASILTKEQAKGAGIFNRTPGHSGAYGLQRSVYTELQEECWKAGVAEGTTWYALIGQHVAPADVTIAIDPDGIAHELMLFERATDLLHEHHPATRPSVVDEDDAEEEEGDEIPHDAPGPQANERPSAPSAVSKVESNTAKWERERAETQRVDTEVMLRAFAIAKASAKDLSDVRLLKVLAEQLVSSLGLVSAGSLATYLKPATKFTGVAALRDAVDDCDLTDLRAVVTTLAVANVLESLSDWADDVSEIDGSAILDHLKINISTIAADVKAGRPAPKKAKAPKEPTRVKPGPKAGTKTGPKAKAKPAGKVTVHRSRKK